MTTRSAAALLAAVLLLPGSVMAAQKAPSVAFETLSGQSKELADYRGKLVLVNFWAPWCPPCRREMPDLQSFHERHDDTVVLGLAVQAKSRKSVTNMVDMMQVEYPVVMSNAATARQFGSFRGLPTTFIVGPEGRIQAQHAGLLTPEAMQEYRRKILDDTSGS